MRRLLYLLLLSCLVPGRPHAQQQYLFTHLGTRDGLVSNAVMSVQQDAKGYIWIGTMEGVQRYDGYRFLLFAHDPRDPNSLPNNKVEQVQLDRHNRLWILCNYNKLGYIDLTELRYHPVAVRIGEEDQTKGEGHLEMDRDGHLFLILANRAALMYDEQGRAFTGKGLPFSFPAGWKLYSIFEDSTSCYWLGMDGGLVKYDPARRTLSYRGHNTDKDRVIDHYQQLTHITFPYIDRKGRFWVRSWPSDGSGPQYLSLDLHTGQGHSWGSSIGRMLKGRYQEMHFFHEQPNGTIWVGGINLLAVLRPQSDSFELVQSTAGGGFNFLYDIVQQLLEDREQNIWLATDRGIYRCNPGSQPFRSISNRLPGRDSAFTADVNDIVQISNNDILVATWGSGLFAYDSAFRPVDRWYIRQSQKLGEQAVWCIHERPNGDIWRGHQAGVLFITHFATHITEKLTLPVFHQSTIRQITEDRNGNLWIGTQRGDLIRWDARSNNFSLVRNLNSHVQRLYIDRKGTLWACTMLDGVFRIDPSNGTVLAHFTADGETGRRLSGIGAADILQFTDSLFMIAGDNLNILNIRTGNIRVDSTISTVFFNGAFNLARDRKGYVWVTTPTGICRMNMHGQVRSHFSEEDGVGTNAFNLAASGELKDGRIVFGTVHDMIVFQPASILSADLPPPDIEITGLLVQNKWLRMDSVLRLREIDLPYDGNPLRIMLSTLTYQNSYGIIYQLEGIDKGWVSAQNGEALYNYLPPGHYTFRVKGVNADDAFSPHTRELVLHISGPFWRSWWFLSLLLLAGAVLLYLLDRQRMQRKAAMEKMRSDISGNLHEEINKALQNINVLSEIARIKAERAPEQSINYINEIHHKSRKMIIAMDDMLWAIDPANDTMSRVIDRMKEFSEALSRNHAIPIGLEAAEVIRRLQPDMKVRHELLTIFKLVLRLLVEEMNAPDLSIQLDQDKGMLHLSFYSSGLRIIDREGRYAREVDEIKARGMAIRGTLYLQSDEKGTAVLFICPSTF